MLLIWANKRGGNTNYTLSLQFKICCRPIYKSLMDAYVRRIADTVWTKERVFYSYPDICELDPSLPSSRFKRIPRASEESFAVVMRYLLYVKCLHFFMQIEISSFYI